MGFFREIIKIINEEILEELSGRDVNSVGLAEQMVNKEGDKTTIFPCYIDESGEGVYVGPDDDHEIIIYHRISSLTIQKAQLPAYGDARKIDSQIVNVALVVFGQRDKLKLTNDELAMIIYAAIPEAAERDWLKKYKLKACNINVQTMNLDSMKVFNEEYSNVQYFIRPEQFLFKINYTIESAFLKKCFKKCGC